MEPEENAHNFSMSHQNPLQTSSGIRPSTHRVQKDFESELLMEDSERLPGYEESPAIVERPFYWRVFGEEQHIDDEENISQNVMIQKKRAKVDISDGFDDKLNFSEQKFEYENAWQEVTDLQLQDLQPRHLAGSFEDEVTDRFDKMLDHVICRTHGISTHRDYE